MALKIFLVTEVQMHVCQRARGVLQLLCMYSATVSMHFFQDAFLQGKMLHKMVATGSCKLKKLVAWAQKRTNSRF